MFCSKCGKTLPADARRCPSCDQEVGDSRFDGVPYTAAQARILPGAANGRQREARPYTKITYTDRNDQLQSDADEDARTSYRPVYEGASVPEEIRGDVRRAMGVEPDAGDSDRRDDSAEAERVRELFGPEGEEQGLDDFDLSQLRSRPIVSEGRAGISKDVVEYVEKLSTSERTGRRAKHRAVYGAEEVDGQRVSGEETPHEESRDAYDDEAPGEPVPILGNINVRTVIKIAGTVLVIVLLAVIGKTVYNRITDIKKNSSPIEGVSQTLYTNGIALLEAHQEDAYVTSLIQKFTDDGIVAVTGQLTQDAAAIDALTASAEEEPGVNDALFISVLSSIQENIGNAVTMDVLSLSEDQQTAVAASSERWQVVRDSIVQLKAATGATELTAILGGAKISIATPTAEPTATPKVYTPLSKGDESNAVYEMQTRLYALGYLNDDRDGKFGTKTQTAVKWFQSEAGLDVTGVADAMTLTLLYSDDAPKTEYAPVTATPTIAPTATPQAATQAPTQTEPALAQ